MNFWQIGKKIVAVGRNYAQHAKELGNEIPKEPVIFLKPTSSYLRQGSNSFIRIPKGAEVHHEVELGVVISKKCVNVESSKASDYIAGYALALDMTARNLQDIAKKGGLPWTQAKGFDTFCPIGEFIGKDKIKDHQNVEIWLKVNDKLRQKGNTKNMLFPINNLISYISSFMTLEEGDLILTGTPEGVGKVVSGDVLTGGITGVPNSEFKFIAQDWVSKL